MTEHWTPANSPRRRRSAPWLHDEPELLELRQETIELRRVNRGASSAGPRVGAARTADRRNARPRLDDRRAPRARRSRRARRRWRLVLPLAIVLVALIAVIEHSSAGQGSYPLPGRASLSGLGLGRRIVAIADSQLGYSTDPTRSYCNKFSAYWGAGTQSCPVGESSEEWCADFAAWAWRKAGVPFAYGFGADEIDASAASFYTWGVEHGTWHSVAGGYRARPGDVAVYGLRLGTAALAAHVAVVTADPAGQRGPDVVNGDGDRTGFSVVETGTDQLRADTGHRHGALLDGYVSPD